MEPSHTLLLTIMKESRCSLGRRVWWGRGGWQVVISHRRKEWEWMVLISRSESTETTGETPEVCVTQQPAQSLLHEPQRSVRLFDLQARTNADTPRHSWKVKLELRREEEAGSLTCKYEEIEKCDGPEGFDECVSVCVGGDKGRFHTFSHSFSHSSRSRCPTLPDECSAVC